MHFEQLHTTHSGVASQWASLELRASHGSAEEAVYALARATEKFLRLARNDKAVAGNLSQRELSRGRHVIQALFQARAHPDPEMYKRVLSACELRNIYLHELPERVDRVAIAKAVTDIRNAADLLFADRQPASHSRRLVAREPAVDRVVERYDPELVTERSPRRWIQLLLGLGQAGAESLCVDLDPLWDESYETRELDVSVVGTVRMAIFADALLTRLRLATSGPRDAVMAAYFAHSALSGLAWNRTVAGAVAKRVLDCCRHTCSDVDTLEAAASMAISEADSRRSDYCAAAREMDEWVLTGDGELAVRRAEVHARLSGGFARFGAKQ